MGAKHTPGPWVYGEDQRGRKRVFDETGHEIVKALSASGVYRLTLTEREANARLIAAAPDLLAALKKSFENDNAAAHGQRMRHSPIPLLNEMRDAIAKAEGRS